MVVTALIYSGLSNPTWTVPKSRVAEVARAIAGLPRLDGDCAPQGGLGYSGVRLDVSNGEGDAQSWIFAKGVAAAASGCFRDTDRKVERLLLEMGRDHVAPALLDAMLR